jgi:outer membrane cobalamin receptor
MGIGSPNSAPPDLNQIPAALVERVEVLTGGASAVYGSDAIAGVVNFIMRDDFEGFRIDGQYGFFQHEPCCASASTTCSTATRRYLRTSEPGSETATLIPRSTMLRGAGCSWA